MCACRQVPYHITAYAGTSGWLFYRLSEGEGYYLKACSSDVTCVVQSSNILWKTDELPMNLCPPDLLPNFVVKDDTLCCKESFVYVNGFDKNLPTLKLVAPTTTWSTEGTFCFYFFLTNSLTPTAGSDITFFEYGPLIIKLAATATKITFTPYHYDGTTTTQLGTAGLDIIISASVWDSVCLSFIYDAAAPGYNGFMCEMQTGASITFSAIPTTVDFTPAAGAYPKFTGLNSNTPIIVKSVLISTLSTTSAEIQNFFWGNTY